MRPRSRGARCLRIASLVLAGVAGRAVAEASPPLALRLQLQGTALVWEIVAHDDLAILSSRVHAIVTHGSPALPLPEALGDPVTLAAGATLAGRVQLLQVPPGAWFEARVQVATEHGVLWFGASTRAPAPAAAAARLSKPTSGEPGIVSARCHYEDRLFDAGGYTGETQELSLRRVDAELVAADGTVLASASLQADGTVRLPIPAGAAGAARLRLWSSTRLQRDVDVAVLDPVEVDGRTEFRRHALETPSFSLDGAGVDLGTIVFRDPDGFGHLQAFHVLDVALDAWDALASPDLGGAPRDSLRFFWGPSARLRVTAFGGNGIQIASPGSGDTDGWSDAVILHEVGHFVARRLLRDDSRGGVHLLGDVELDLSLAYSEGLANAFACIVRAWRAAARRNAAGAAADAAVSWYVDLGMPPPDGVAGGLGFAWDVESLRWADGTALPRGSLGSETTVAGTLWDLADGTATPDTSRDSDDDPGALAMARLWGALRDLRSLPASTQVTLEDFWHVASESFDPEEMRLLQRICVEHARLPFHLDALEPDTHPERARLLGFAYPARVPGGVVIDEIDLGRTSAVEITNRGSEWVELAGWSLRARRNGVSLNPGFTYLFQPGSRLAPGARLVVHRGGRMDDSTPLDVFAPAWNTPWFPESDGALVLADAAGLAVDFVRWDAKDGTRSEALVPEETSFSGRLPAPGYGRTLSRAPVADHDEANDFVAATATLGLPNDAPIVQRTFFPGGDVDALRLVAHRDGVYTLQVQAPHNGAEPFLELHGPGRPRLVPRSPRPDGGQRLSLWLQAGDEVSGTMWHRGTRTRYGSYTFAAYAESEPQQLLAPDGLEARFEPAGATWELRVSWWNAARYDSVHVEIDGEVRSRLPGDAHTGRWEIAEGAHRVRLWAFVQGMAVTTPRLDVQVAPERHTVGDDFDTTADGAWELDGSWSLVPAPGRSGNALTDSPTGDYGLLWRQTARLRAAVQVLPGATICFDHICIVQPEDAATLEVSDDWGSRWSVLGRWSLESRRGGPGEPDWSDRRADPQDWAHECIPLDAFVGRSVQVRLRLETDFHGSADGWYIDALRLGLPPPLGTAPRLRLGPALPNPFNPRTRIEYEVPAQGQVELRVLDVRGRVVRTLFRGPQPAGVHHVFWNGDTTDGRPAGSGVYLVHLRAAGEQRSAKVVLLR